jgi:hypothetical protein
MDRFKRLYEKRQKEYDVLMSMDLTRPYLIDRRKSLEVWLVSQRERYYLYMIILSEFKGSNLPDGGQI